jgi:hypothetical protein
VLLLLCGLLLHHAGLLLLCGLLLVGARERRSG